MKIANLLEYLYSEIRQTYEEEPEEMFFYEFINGKCTIYKDLVAHLDQEELVSTLKKYGSFKGNVTHKRFSNYCNLIFEECITILDNYYKGNLWIAHKRLYDLLKSKNKFSHYWEDDYVNAFSFEFLKEKCLYRMVDMRIGEILNDCWHIHYENRRFASYSRFSMAGIPCLYLADSKETANSECGEIQKGKQRWFSRFTPNNEKTLFFDLRIPSKEKISKYNPIDLIITYPIRLLCSVKVANAGGNYPEEYYFPQLLFHLFFMTDISDLRNSYKGFVYSSTAKQGGENYVLPALYKSNTPLLNGISPELEKLFYTTKPATY